MCTVLDSDSGISASGVQFQDGLLERKQKVMENNQLLYTQLDFTVSCIYLLHFEIFKNIGAESSYDKIHTGTALW